MQDRRPVIARQRLLASLLQPNDLAPARPSVQRLPNACVMRTRFCSVKSAIVSVGPFDTEKTLESRLTFQLPNGFCHLLVTTENGSRVVFMEEFKVAISLISPATGRCLIGFAVLLLMQSIGPLQAIEPVALEDEFASSIRENAQLNDLSVVSESRIVAVGNCGHIQYSDSGGRQWQSIDSPTTDNLHSVAIAPSGVGVCVGGRIGSHTRKSQATILRTEDGGKTWAAIPVAGLPRLIGVTLSSGVFTAWGDLSDTFGTGVFRSTDGGLHWQALKTPIGHVVAAGGFESGGFGAVDRLGNAVLRLGQTTGMPLSDFSRRINALHHNGQNWLAVGAAGEFIASSDGKIWTSVPLPLGDQARQCVDFEFISQTGQDIWVGGTPGSILMHSNDLGQTWKKVPTGQSTPVRAVQFYDHDRGWAICGFGRICATRDGGQTWYIQRDSAERLGVLSVARSELGGSWIPTVSANWERRCTSGLLLLGPVDPVEFADSVPAKAILLNSLASQIGLVEFRSLLGEEALLPQRLAVQLLSLRPDVLLVSDDVEQAESRFYPTLPKASELAADAMRFAAKAGQEHIARELHLAPWEVKKLAAVCNEGSHHYSESPHRVLSSAGLAVRDVMASLPVGSCDLDSPVYMRTLWSSSQAASATKSLMGAIPPAKQTTLSRPLVELGNYQLIMGRIHREKILQRVVDEARKYSLNRNETAQAETLWTQQLSALMKGMPRYEFDRAALKLASELDDPRLERFRQTALGEIARLGKGRDIATEARWQLLSRAESDERAAWLDSIQGDTPGNTTAVQTAQATGDATSRGVWNATPFTEANMGGAAVQTVGHLEPTRPYAPAPKPWLNLMAEALDADAALATKPEFNLVLAARKRKSFHDSALKTLADLASQKGYIGWPQVAAQEVLRRSVGRRPRWQVDVSHIADPPVLDGHLEDACWQNAGLMQLQSKEALRKNSHESFIHWALDEEYLYLAFDCPVEDASQLKPLVAQRDYDSDIRDVDHVELLLDTDRDYAVGIQIAVAEDGRTFDRCGGNPSYNPKWYVAVAHHARSWSAEIAIPLSELTTASFEDLDAWAVAARRTNPHGHAETWSLLHTNQLSLRSAGLVQFPSTVK